MIDNFFLGVSKMEGFIIAAVVVAWFCSLVYCVIKAEYSETPLFWLGFGVVILCSGLGFVIQQEIYEQKEGPCLAYEERSVYDPALKIMRKVDVCVERGVWKE